MKTTNAISLKEKLNEIDDYWQPHIVCSLNGQDVKIARIKGEFIWHKHDDADEMFMVLKGELKIHLPDTTVNLKEGQIYVVPRGVEHKPVAEDEVHILLFEPAGTLNTGNVRNELTVDNPRKLN